MTYRQTCILLPCHGLEDFPMHHEGADADGLLAAWTALWHPALLAATGAAPNWHRGDSPPQDLSNMLIVVPAVSQHELPTGFPERAAEEGARVIMGNLSREEILRQALEPVADQVNAIDRELTADFLALGYCYLQVELLTRQTRYSTNLDEIHFYHQVIEGARAAVAGDQQQAQEKLTACFDLLAQERDHYYAVDAYILDFTLLAATTLGTALREQLAPKIPVNLLLTADLLCQLQHTESESYAALRQGLQDGYVGLVGGDAREERAPLHSCETVLNQLRHGLSLFEDHLGERPKVYGRRRFGVSVLYPQLLGRLGYVGVLHAALGEGQYPEGSQLKIRWEGPDHNAIDAIARLPLDAARSATFLSLASKLGETMDMDHVATVCLAHWPGRVCPWYHDLRRVARYGAILGKFMTVDAYFRDTDYPGQTERFKADQYRSLYLPQAIEQQAADPISTSVRYWRRRCQITAAQALEMLSATMQRRPGDMTSRLIDEVDAAADHAAPEDLDHQICESLRQAARQASALLPRQAAAATPGYLVWNPSNHARRAAVDLPALPSLPTVRKPVYAAHADEEHKYVVVDVPPMGFAWISGGPPPRPSKRKTRVLAEENRIYNEYFEAHVNPTTGALQALYEYEQRGNRLSQLLALRRPRRGSSSKQAAGIYSVMSADRVAVTAASPVMGEITAAGRLLDQRGDVQAHFRQQFRAWRGSRVLQLTIELEPVTPLADDPWDSYYCCRVAWANEAALLWRGVNQMRERAEAKRFEAPNYIDIDDEGRHTTLLTGGLPFHRRTHLRMLDSLLIVKGETVTTFELGIGVNLKYPLQESLALMSPLPVVESQAGPLQGPSSSWLFHVDSRNVLATAWSPIVTDGIVTGFRVRLLETSGRAARTTLRSCHSITRAARYNFVGQSLGTCRVEDGAAVVDLGANEWLEVEASWSGN